MHRPVESFVVGELVYREPSDAEWAAIDYDPDKVKKLRVEEVRDNPNVRCSCGGVGRYHDEFRCDYFRRHPQEVRLEGETEFVNGYDVRRVN